MDESIETSYYRDQLNKIEFNGDYWATVKIKDVKNETKWMDVNEHSARVIIEVLKKQFNIE